MNRVKTSKAQFVREHPGKTIDEVMLIAKAASFSLTRADVYAEHANMKKRARAAKAAQRASKRDAAKTVRTATAAHVARAPSSSDFRNAVEAEIARHQSAIDKLRAVLEDLDEP